MMCTEVFVISYNQHVMPFGHYIKETTNILKNYAKEFFENIIESKNIKTRKKLDFS